MEGDEQRKFVSGRGRAILQMMQNVEQSAVRPAGEPPVENPAPSQRRSAISTMMRFAHATAASSRSAEPRQGNIPEAVAHVTPMGSDTRGPELPTFGRGSVAKLLQGMSLAEHAPASQQSNVPPPSAVPADSAGTSDRLSRASIQESSVSQLSYEKPKPVCKQGTVGQKIDMNANYIKLRTDPEKGVFRYEVKFHPDIDSRPLRTKLLNQHLEIIGRNKIFDGSLLYLPQKLPPNANVLRSEHPMDNSTVTLTFIFQKEETIAKQITFFNVLLGRIMRALSLIRIGQHSFNPSGVRGVPQHKLEVWPGYVTNISKYEGGLQLCMDTKHRVMRTETVYSLILSLRNKPNFKEAVTKEVVGMSVFTRYNNRTYRIDDIAWDKSPRLEFDKNGQPTTLIDYYRSHWSLQIKDHGQPLLVHHARDKLPSGEKKENLILLVPELCFVTGLTDSMRSDFRVMKDLHAITSESPDERRKTILHFLNEVKQNDIARDILSSWGLRLEDDLINFTGRVLPPEVMYFGDDKTFTLSANKPADWTGAATSQPVLRTPHLTSWCIIHTQRDGKCANDFQVMLRKVTMVMGMQVNEPKMVALSDDRTESYLHVIRANAEHVNLVLVIFPTNRSDRYSAVKRFCCLQKPVPSQVVMARTISRSDKLKSITQKIALQINCKLGGALWALSIPISNCMVCGIDVYHAGVGNVKCSVAGFVASLDKSLTKWHSRVCIQGVNQELIDLLQGCLISAVETYLKHNQVYPDRIIIYRDGVGEGQLDTVAHYEIKQILETFKSIGQGYMPKLSVIVVQKRLNTRLFAKCRTGLINPPPGTVVDSDITKEDYYDFFLVSQNGRQGTVTPTRYIVLYDSTNMKSDHMQRLTYKLCHLYYNFTGTIKVPAPCQYAHKLVYLVGQSIRTEPHKSLSNNLYYL